MRSEPNWRTGSTAVHQHIYTRIAQAFLSWQDLVLVLPMFVAAKLGLGHVGALVATFFTYWAIGITLVVWYIRTTGLEATAARNGGSEN